MDNLVPFRSKKRKTESAKTEKKTKRTGERPRRGLIGGLLTVKFIAAMFDIDEKHLQRAIYSLQRQRKVRLKEMKARDVGQLIEHILSCRKAPRSIRNMLNID